MPLKVRLAGLPVSLLKLGITAPLHLIRSGPILQVVALNLEAKIKVGERSQRALHRGQKVIRGNGVLGVSCCRACKAKAKLKGMCASLRLRAGEGPIISNV